MKARRVSSQVQVDTPEGAAKALALVAHCRSSPEEKGRAACIRRALSDRPGFRAVINSGVVTQVVSCLVEHWDADCFNTTPGAVNYERLAPLEAVVSSEADRVAACSVAVPVSDAALPHALLPLTQPAAASARGTATRDGAALAWLTAVGAAPTPVMLPGSCPPTGSDDDDAAAAAAARTPPASILLDGRPGCWPSGSTSNIVADFLHRSMYAPQLARVFAAFRSSQVRVLLDTALRTQLRATTDAVFNFLRLPPLPPAVPLSPTTIEHMYVGQAPNGGGFAFRFVSRHPPAHHRAPLTHAASTPGLITC